MKNTRNIIIGVSIILSISIICCEGIDLYTLITDPNYAPGLIDCIIDTKPCDEPGEDIKGENQRCLIHFINYKQRLY